MHVVFEYPVAYYNPWRDHLGRYMIEMLDELGYRGSARPANVYSSRNDSQMALAAWAADYPAASTFIVNHLRCDASQTPLSGFCDRGIDSMIDRAIQMQADDPAAADALWAEIDRAILDHAPFLWLVNPVAVEFVSERVGNYQWSFQWGGLLNQLWVR